MLFSPCFQATNRMKYQLEINNLVSILFDSGLVDCLTVPTGPDIEIDGTKYAVHSRKFSIDTKATPPEMKHTIVVT